MTITVTLSAEDRQRILDGNRQQAAIIADAAAPKVLSPNHFAFFAAFDGTNNDFLRDPRATSVGELFRQGSLSNNPIHIARYFAGPGTAGTLTASSWLNPQVTSQVVRQARAAYGELFQEAADYLRDFPGAPISVALTSFSRGGASAAIFSQLIWANGLTDPRDPSRVLLAPGQVPVSAGVIFDPVLTGVSGNMAFAPNATNIVDILARDEYRSFFRAFDYRTSRNIRTIPMFGSHSDVGGSYDEGIFYQ